jgi:hypothetical protein
MATCLRVAAFSLRRYFGEGRERRIAYPILKGGPFVFNIPIKVTETPQSREVGISPESPGPLWMPWPRLAPPSEQTTYPYEREVSPVKAIREFILCRNRDAQDTRCLARFTWNEATQTQ